jgi:hypothetical protein
MVHLTKNQVENIYLTLTEKATLAAPNYLFYFKNRVTNEVVAFVRTYAQNISAHKDRYDQFQLTVNTSFQSATAGEWEYYIYEQTSASNTDPSLALGMLESGIMDLNEATGFAFTKYNTNNTFITR